MAIDNKFFIIRDNGDEEEVTKTLGGCLINFKGEMTYPTASFTLKGVRYTDIEVIMNLEGDIMENRVEVITCQTGDWEVLTLNDEVIAEGHSLSNMDWLTLLDKLDILFGGREISDEDMEAGCY